MCDKPLSNLALNFKLRPCTEDPEQMLRLARLLRMLKDTSERVSKHSHLLHEAQAMDEAWLQSAPYTPPPLFQLST